MTDFPVFKPSEGRTLCTGCSSQGARTGFQQDCRFTAIDPVEFDRLGNILQGVRSKILEAEFWPATDGAADQIRHADAADRGRRLNSVCLVEAVAIGPGILLEDFAQMHTGPEFEPKISLVLVGALQGLLEFQRCTDGTRHAVKNRQRAISGEVQDAAVLFPDLGGEQIEGAFDGAQRPHLVQRHRQC